MIEKSEIQDLISQLNEVKSKMQELNSDDDFRLNALASIALQDVTHALDCLEVLII